MLTDVTGSGELHMLTGAYALDALDDGERAEFEAHMVGCSTCRDEVIELQGTAGLLGLAAAEAPPGSLKARVMAEVDRTRQEAPATTTGSNVVALPRRGGARIFQLAAAVLTIIAVAAGAWGVQNHQRSDDINGKYAALRSVLAAPDAQVGSGTLSGSNLSGHATVVVSKSLGRAAFVTSDFSRAPSNRTYELWFINATGKARPAGLVDVGSNGSATQLLRGSVGDASVIGVTVEPSGGSAQPTSKPVLTVSL